MFRRFLLLPGLLAVSVGLPGCTLFYPRFDSLLNPDIAFPNIAEVVDSVKCAVTSFYVERAARIRGEAQRKLREALEEKKGRNVDTEFCPAPDYGKPQWRIVLFVQDPKDEYDPCFSPKIKVMPDDYNPGEGDLKDGCEPYFGAYKYVSVEKKRCVANGGCVPGTTRQQNRYRGIVTFKDKKDLKVKGNDDREGENGDSKGGKCILDDRSAFALDPTGKAKVELTIQAINTGSMNYQKIDATGFLPYIIVPGDQAKGFPFPTLKATDKKTNKVEISLTMPQADSVREDRVTDEKDPNASENTKVREKLEKLMDLRIKERNKPPPARPGAQTRWRHHKHDMTISLDADIESARALVVAGLDDYDKCGSLKINFLALSDYLNSIISQHDAIAAGGSKGGIQAGLDSITLTSQFQIVMDATAGTQHLLRIVPVLQPPVLSLNPDHTHTLKMTFAGKKTRGFESTAPNLVRRCMERFVGLYPIDRDKVKEICNDPRTVLFESLIESVEDNKGGKSAN